MNGVGRAFGRGPHLFMGACVPARKGNLNRNNKPNMKKTRPREGGEVRDERKDAVATSMERAVSRGADPYAVYCEYLAREAQRIAKKSVRLGEDAFDIAQKLSEKFLRHQKQYMILYPNPVDFVRASWKRMSIDHRRNQQAQRGEGSHADGKGRKRRRVDSTEQHEGRHLEIRDLAANVEERILSQAGVAAILGLLDATDAVIIEMAFIEKCTDAEIGEYLDLTRETVNRRRNAAVKFLRERLGEGEI